MEASFYIYDRPLADVNVKKTKFRLTLPLPLLRGSRPNRDSSKQ